MYIHTHMRVCIYIYIYIYKEYSEKLSRWTIVHEAVRRGQAWALGRVLEAGASAIALARGGSGGDVHPLVLAYRLMSLQCAEVLLSVGADSLDHDGAPAAGAASLVLKEELDSVFDVDDDSAPKANLRALLMLAAARSGKQRHEDIRRAGAEYPDMCKEEYWLWVEEMMRQKLYGGCITLMDMFQHVDSVQIQYVDLQFANINMTAMDLSRLLETVSEEKLGLRYFRPPVRLRPIFLLRLSLLRFVDSSFPGYSPWTCSCLSVYRCLKLIIILYTKYVTFRPPNWLTVGQKIGELVAISKGYAGGLGGRGVLLCLSQKLSQHEAIKLDKGFWTQAESNALELEAKQCNDLSAAEVAELISAFPEATSVFLRACLTKAEIAQELVYFNAWKNRFPNERTEAGLKQRTEIELSARMMTLGMMMTMEEFEKVRDKQDHNKTT